MKRQTRGNRIRRDQLLLSAGLLLVAGLAWFYLLRAAAMMHATAAETAMHAAMGMPMPGGEKTGAAELAGLWLMWAVMMAAMMLASATPVVLLVLATYRHRGERAAPLCSIAFVGGYLFVWTLFSGLAATAQTLLHHATLLSPQMASNSRMLAAGVLAGAGVYQWLPIKNACLVHCRSPLDFLSTHWKEGPRGAFAMGFQHGAYCVGCCWMLMALLFVGGVMNLLFVAAIAVYVLAEKQVRWDVWPSRVGGILLIGWSVLIFVRV